MGNFQSHDISVITNYQLFEYTKRTLYNIYNAETLEKLIDTVHYIHNIITPNKKLFAGELNTAYVNKQGI